MCHQHNRLATAPNSTDDSPHSYLAVRHGTAFLCLELKYVLGFLLHKPQQTVDWNLNCLLKVRLYGVLARCTLQSMDTNQTV